MSAASWIVERALSQSIAPLAQRATLAAGEREALSLALELRAAHIVVDEKAARQAALALGLTDGGETRQGAFVNAEQAKAKSFGSVRVELVNDNIADRKVDVFVNAANDQLQMGGGVAAALRSRGGIEIHQEAIRHAPAQLGAVVRTGAGALDARYVYHGVVIDYEIRKGTSAVDVAEVVRNVVRMAVADDVRSIAMPLFGSGVGGLSVEVSLNTILQGLEAAAPEVQQPLLVEIVVRDAEEFEQASSIFREYGGKEAREAEENRLAEEALRKLLGG